MKIHHLNGYIQSIYLVEYDHGLLLLDGCCRADISVILEYIEDKLNRKISDLKTIVVTHMHPDHAGAAHKLRQISGCVIVSANKDTHWYKGLNGILMHWIDVILTLYVGRKLKKKYKYIYYSRKLKADIKSNNGDKVTHFPEWTILETPGHTDRDLSVWHQERNWVYVADLIIKLRNKYISPFPVFHPNKYRASLNIIKQLQSEKIMLAHGGLVSMQNNDFEEMIEKSPQIPRTPLRATLIKFKKIVG
ncbi:MAG: MBL fold metallo-hydrolase [Marinicellaceae bacterium]